MSRPAIYLTGETRGYKGGKWDRTKVLKPFSKGGWGAFQINGRVDYLDLDATGVAPARRTLTCTAPHLRQGRQAARLPGQPDLEPEDYLRFMLIFDDRHHRRPARGDGRADPTEPVNKRKYRRRHRAAPGSRSTSNALCTAYRKAPSHQRRGRFFMCRATGYKISFAFAARDAQACHIDRGGCDASFAGLLLMSRPRGGLAQADDGATSAGRNRAGRRRGHHLQQQSRAGSGPPRPRASRRPLAPGISRCLGPDPARDGVAERRRTSASSSRISTSTCCRRRR